MELKNSQWITTARDLGDVCPVFRRRFCAEKEIASAALEITALGVYEAELNGRRVGDFVLAPGWTSYDHRLQVQTYDVAEMLRNKNELRVTVGRGWFRSPMPGFVDSEDKHRRYDQPCGLIARLYIRYTDGSENVLDTDESWEFAESPVRFSEIYDGECYDAAFSPKNWEAVRLLAWSKEILIPQEGETVRETERVAARAVLHTPAGETVIDFGQEVTGYVEFSVTAREGDEIRFTHGEMLDADGNFYNANYRTAKAELSYCCREGSQTWHPRLTFFGFRYIKLLSWPGDVKAEDFTAVVVHSDMKRIGWLESGDPMLNQLFSNIVWGQRGNFLDVPTDCPQRDERLGWTGDAQAISATACQSLYMPAFYRKYLWDMRAEQSTLEGSVPNVVPRIKQGMIGEHGSSPWADAAGIIPWNVWRYYGSRELLRECYPGMKAWVDCQRRREEAIGGEHLVKDGFHFADWLALDNPQPGPFGATDPLYIASAYYFRCAQILAEAGEILDLPEAADYRRLAGEILRALREQYFDENGLCRIRTQTAAALALVFGLTESPEAQGRRLRELVAENGEHLNTGFVGTPILCEALSMSGHHDAAVTLLLQEDYPSWLYSVKLGATTIWERWNSVLPDGHMNPEGMNSLNHYTYGSIAGWMISWLCGLRPAEPGYRRAVLEPRPDRRLGQARVELDTAAGRFVSAWRYEGDSLHYAFTVPFGASAELHLPGQAPKELGAGSYTF